MPTNKSTKIIYWISTTIIFLFEGVMPAFTGHSELAKSGILDLGYPEYFITMLVVYKVLGSVAIILPMIPPRVKEWAYAGLAFSLISAFISNAAVDGAQPILLFPVVIFAILLTSYLTYHKLLISK